MLQDMFAVESKHTDDVQSLSIDSLHDLRLNDIINSDRNGAVFTAEITPYQPGILGMC